MLVELSIENLGIIQSVRLSFRDGFTVFTGETGAGKTLLVEAINLVVGRRADASVIRDGADEARVEARFLRHVDGEEQEVILCRVVQREGRSRAYINDRMATVAMLSEIGEELVDIHGQHAHQRLLSPATQRDALDTYAGIDMSRLRVARERVIEVEAMLAALGGDEKSRMREIDLLQFQCEEIESAGLSDPAEDDALSEEEDQLADVVKHQEALWSAVDTLGGEGGVVDGLRAAFRSLSPLKSARGETERIESLLADADELVRHLRSAAESAEENPERLEEIRLRRQLLRDLKRKYGDSLSDVIEFGVDSRQRLDELMRYADRVQELEVQRTAALTELRRCQKSVGDQRRKAAPGLGLAVQARLRDLALPTADVKVSVGDADGDLAGESVVFMLAANPGSAPQPLTKVASGGELARVMLAIRLVLTSSPATMVFDEVDAGIGGSAAVSVATALRELGNAHQVFAVTHLPQVAASAHQQIVVSKTVKNGKTFGGAVEIPAQERPGEIARMLSGGVADDSATAHATDLLRSLGELKPGSKGLK